MSTSVSFEQVATVMAARQEGSPRPAAEDLRALLVSSRVPHRSPQLRTATAKGVVIMHGEIDIANHQLFAMVVGGVTDHVGGEDTSQSEVHLDLADLDVIGVGSARVLVTAAAKRGPDDQLVIHHPPATRVRILQLSWGPLSGLGFEQQPGTLPECAPWS